MTEVDRCWICLGNDGDAPPLSQPLDSTHLMSPCKCSLRAHKRCLLDWASDVDFKSRRNDNNTDDIGIQVDDNGVLLQLRENISFNTSNLFSLGLSNNSKIFISEQVKCPQCKSSIIITMKPSYLLSINTFLQNALKTSSKLITYTSIVSTIGASITFSIYSILTSLGIKMIYSLSPESTIMKLLNLKESTFSKALSNNSVSFQKISLISGLPLYLFGLRSNNLISSIYINLYPLLYLSSSAGFEDPFFQNIEWNDPRVFLLFGDVFKTTYQFIYSLTFNHFYYRWCQLIKPCLIVDKVSLEELEEMELENQEYYSIINDQIDPNVSIWRRLQNWVFPVYTPEQSKVIQRHDKRELKAILNKDYTKVFQSTNSIFIKLATTIAWPFLGSFIGSNLTKLKHIRSLVAEISQTPDDATYLTNLIGCCIVVLLKDLVNLGFAYKQLKQYRNIDIVDNESLKLITNV